MSVGRRRSMTSRGAPPHEMSRNVAQPGERTSAPARLWRGMHRSDDRIHVTVPGRPTDPRLDESISGVVIHRTPPLHPDDVWIVDGIRITSPSRTLIDCAEELEADELRLLFLAAVARGLLDPDALRAARARVEWRPSLATFDEVMGEFCGEP